MSKHLIVGVLGMPDNAGTANLLQRFDREAEVSIDFVVYWRPSFRDQFARSMRKLRSSGLGPTIQRGIYALRHSRRKGRPTPRICDIPSPCASSS